MKKKENVEVHVKTEENVKRYKNRHPKLPPLHNVCKGLSDLETFLNSEK